MKGLTKRQNEIVDYIKEYLSQHGHAPSYREIASAFQFSSIGTVYNHVKVLKRKGAIQGEYHGKRSLYLSEETLPKTEDPSAVEIPFIGYINANTPIDTFRNIQTITIPQSLIPSPHQTYAFRVQGNGFINELIADGDLVLVEVNTSPQEGDTILGLHNKTEPVIGKYGIQGSYVRINSLTEGTPPLLVHPAEITIQGIVVGLLRIY